MRKTNIDKLKEIYTKIDEYNKNIIDTHLSDEIKNKKYIYSIEPTKNGYTSKEWEIEKISVSYDNGSEDIFSPMIKGKNITKNDVINFENYYNNIQLATPNISFYIKHIYNNGNSESLSIAELSKINGKDFAFNKEDLTEEIERKNKIYEEIYKSRDGYTACSYCGKQTPNEKIVNKIIYMNKSKIKLPFCSDYCAYCMQCASEG